MAVNTQDDVAKHLDEPTVQVQGKALLLSALRDSGGHLLVDPQVEYRVHHAGHGYRRARTDRDQQWV